VRRAALILVLGLLAAGCGGSSSSGENGPIVLSGITLNEQSGLFLRETDGTLRRLTGASDIRAVVPAFSHDGERIAYVQLMRGLPGGTGRLMIMDADGGNATQVGDVVAGALQIAWSPDDSSLVYSDVKHGLWTIGADGKGAKRIFADVGEASWSTDGRIVVARPPHGLMTMNDDGSDVRELPRPARPPKALLPDSYSSPVWSPDGKRIAYVLKVWTPSKSFLFPTTMETVDSDGNDRQVVTKVFESGTTLTWSPDGELIAFTDLRDDQPGLWTIPSTGGPVKALIEGTSRYSMPSWGPAGT
jgi:Tol biopolymer transport system component